VYSRRHLCSSCFHPFHSVRHQKRPLYCRY